MDKTEKDYHESVVSGSTVRTVVHSRTPLVYESRKYDPVMMRWLETPTPESHLKVLGISSVKLSKEEAHIKAIEAVISGQLKLPSPDDFPQGHRGDLMYATALENAVLQFVRQYIPDIQPHQVNPQFVKRWGLEEKHLPPQKNLGETHGEVREPVGEKRHEILPDMELVDTFKGARWERGYFQHWYTVALLKDREGKYWIDPDYPSDDPRGLESIGADPKYKEFEDINDSALTPESYTAYVIAGYSPNYHFIEKRVFFSVSYMGRGYFPEDVREIARRIFHTHGVRADAVEHSYYFVRAGHFDKLKEEIEKAGIEVEELSRNDVGAYWDQEGRPV